MFSSPCLFLTLPTTVCLHWAFNYTGDSREVNTVNEGRLVIERSEDNFLAENGINWIKAKYAGLLGKPTFIRCFISLIVYKALTHINVNDLSWSPPTEFFFFFIPKMKMGGEGPAYGHLHLIPVMSLGARVCSKWAAKPQHHILHSQSMNCKQLEFNHDSSPSFMAI